MNANPSNNLSENYNLRDHFLKTNEIPTQSLIRRKMSEPLAAVYFKAMNPKLKVMVGLEPPMKGGGNDWYVPPQDLLEGRSVLKPLKKEYLTKLNYLGIDTICMKLMRKNKMQSEIAQTMAEHDTKWGEIVQATCKRQYEKTAADGAKKNTEIIKNAFGQFKDEYKSSINNIEALLIEAAASEINRIKQETIQAMQEKCKTLLQQQATSLYDAFTSCLNAEKSRLKSEFIEKLECCRGEMGEKIHNANLEKHAAIEESRIYLEYQLLACQVYVALKEQEECKKEMELSKHTHKKKVKTLTDEIAYKDLEIICQEQKDKKISKLVTTWQKKVLQVVKKFQMFVTYCLSSLPEYAEFFINMEKLMMIQLDKVLENPSAESIFKFEEECYVGPTPEPHPFYLFCDKSRKKGKPHLDKDLCPKRCTSSASQMPVIVINKRCMYAACDNFEQFTNKVKQYIHGERGDDVDLTDYHNYDAAVPVRYTTSQQLLELKLESSLVQILQQELPNIREIPVVCNICKVPFCSCVKLVTGKTDTHEQARKQQTASRATSSNMLKSNADLKHKVETGWDSYLKSIVPKHCACAKAAKKHLVNHLPAYMRITSAYEPPVLPNYEICSPSALKKMVREAKGTIDLPLPQEEKNDTTRDMGTQCSDEQYSLLCNCFSDEELLRWLDAKTITETFKMYHPSNTENHQSIVDYSNASKVLTARDGSFAMQRAQSLRALIDTEPGLEELFKAGRLFDSN